jgi:hypothetical protein
MEDPFMKLKIGELVGENCITSQDGVKVYGLIHPELAMNRSVELDFAGCRILASPFLNAAVGQLLEDLSSEQLNRLLNVENLSDDGSRVFRRVVENAAEYFSSPEIRESILTALERQAKTA